MLRFVIAILLLAVPSVAQSAENCPSGQVREVRERVVTPASFLDILSDREVVTESTEILTIPAQWSWLEKPKDYVRPKFVEVEEIHVGSFKWSSAEVEISYQAESHDIIKKLDGTTQRRVVPAVKKKVTRRFPDHSNSFFIRKTNMAFVADKMETATQVRTQTKASLIIDRQVEVLPKYVSDQFDINWKPIPKVYKNLLRPKVIGKIRSPALLEEYLGDCLPINP